MLMYIICFWVLIVRSEVTMSNQRFDEIKGMKFKHLSVFFKKV
jgi:hypothetical protein